VNKKKRYVREKKSPEKSKKDQEEKYKAKKVYASSKTKWVSPSESKSFRLVAAPTEKPLIFTMPSL
jgi:hypothetical protein